MKKLGTSLGKITTAKRVKNELPAGLYKLDGEDLAMPIEIIRQALVHAEFDSPHPTLQGVPSLATIAMRKEKDKNISTLLGQLLALRKKEKEEAHSENDDSFGWSETLDEASDILAKQEPPPLPEGHDIDEPIRLEIKSKKDSARGDSTLVMPVIDEDEVKPPKNDEWLTSIQEFADEFQQKTGPIILSQGNLEKIKIIIAKLKEMSNAEREKRFPKIPLIVRRQILKILASEAAQKKAQPQPPPQKEWPPINVTMTLGGKNPHMHIRLADQNND